MRKEFESIEWDAIKRSVVITTQKIVEIEGAENVEEVKQRIRNRLHERVRQIKILKAEALKDKQLLEKLEGKAGPTDPAPVLEPDPIPVQQKPKS